MSANVSATQVPTLSFYYGLGLVSVDPESHDSECTICVEPCEPSQDIVSVGSPCNHSFHRKCITEWFRKQLFRSNGFRTTAEQGTCPNCRSILWTVNGLTLRDVWANVEIQGFLSLREAGSEHVIRELEIRLKDEGSVSVDLADWALKRMAEIRPGMEDKARALGILPPVHLLVPCVPKRPYAFDVNIETDPALINQVIRLDLNALQLIVKSHVEEEILRASTFRQEPDWVWRIEVIARDWASSGWPRSNYITGPECSVLTAAAALVFALGDRMPFNSMTSFGHLLARADALLLDAQRRARAVPNPPISYRRLLDRPDHWETSTGQVDIYAADQPRIQWIVGLRLRTRGRGADPFGPQPRSY